MNYPMNRFWYRTSLLLLTVLALLIHKPGRAGTPVSIGFYNVENLYDTVPSLFHDDRDYTPQGRMHWNSKRYQNKLQNLSRVIDEMSLDIIGLSEIESEQAIRDLVLTLKTDYNYIHRTTGDYRGMDLALLYKGDKFLPEEVQLIRSDASREFLYVRGELLGRRIDLLVCHLPSLLNEREYRERAMRRLYAFADSLQRNDRDACLVIMGDFNADPRDPIMRRNMHTSRKATADGMLLFNPLLTAARQGMGSYVYDNRWHLYDNIFLSGKFLIGERFAYLRSGIFIRPWLLTEGHSQRRGSPLRTFSGGNYLNGFSDHLPVFVIINPF